jgi:hypothetical protein
VAWVLNNRAAGISQARFNLPNFATLGRAAIDGASPSRSSAAPRAGGFDADAAAARRSAAVAVVDGDERRNATQQRPRLDRLVAVKKSTLPVVCNFIRYRMLRTPTCSALSTNRLKSPSDTVIGSGDSAGAITVP